MDLCSICIEEINDSFTCKTCKNSFHNGCIQKWLERKNNCPLCRTQLKERVPNYSDSDSEEYSETDSDYMPSVRSVEDPREYSIDVHTGILTIISDGEITRYNLDLDEEFEQAIGVSQIANQIARNYIVLRKEMETMNFLFNS